MKINEMLNKYGIIAFKRYSHDDFDQYIFFIKSSITKEDADAITEYFGGDRWIFDPANDIKYDSDDFEGSFDDTCYHKAGSMMFTARVPTDNKD